MPKSLLCHVVTPDLHEVGKVKCKLYAQEFSWKKRMWAIPKEAVPIVDKKGIEHMYFDVNEADGVIRFLSPEKLNYDKIDKCIKCGDRISIDARNQHDLNKRLTIKAIFGTDATYLTLLIIMGIGMLIALGAVFYFLGENRKMSDTLVKLTEQYGQLVSRANPEPAQFLLGLIILGI